MARREESAVWSGPCPCGEGRVTKVRIDYLHMYSRPDYDARCDCPVCEAEYRFKAGARSGVTAAPKSGGKTVVLEPPG